MKRKPKNTRKNHFLVSGLFLLLVVTGIAYLSQNSALFRQREQTTATVVTTNDIFVSHPTAKSNNFELVGFLENDNGQTKPLLAQQSQNHRGRFLYVTETNNHNHNLRLPIYHEDQKCTASLGCNELFGDEQIRVLDDSWTVNLYEKQILRTS